MKYQHILQLLVVLFCLVNPTFSFERRNLVSAAPIRITIDNNTNTNSHQFRDTYTMDYLNNLLNVTKQYFKDFLKVNSPATRSEFDFNTCEQEFSDIIFEQNDSLNQSDLHLVVRVIDDATKPNLVVAQPCHNSPQTKRTTVAVLTVNRTLLNQNKFNRQLNHFKKAIFRVLGFSKDAIKRWPNYNDQTIQRGVVNQGSSTKKLLLKNSVALQAFIQHTSCDTLQGIPLEINQTMQGVEYELEKSFFGNELLTGFFEQEPVVVSNVSWSILEASGWYTKNSANQANVDKNLWGLNGGCVFVNKPLEVIADDSPDFQCSKTQFSIQVPASIPFYDSDRVWKTSTLCTDYTHQYTFEDEISLNEFGENSRCFSSTVVSTGFQVDSDVRCHRFICGDDKLIIEIGGKKFPCVSNKCQVSADNFSGVVTLSQNDFKNLCQNQAPKACPNCSDKGYCSQGKCFCVSGFSGKYCEIECNGVLVNGVCQNGGSTCPGSLQLDSTNNTCGCVGSTYVEGSQCVDACSQGYILDKELGECLPCDDKCQDCSGTTDNCGQCASGYYKLETSNPDCVDHCPPEFYQEGQICKPCADNCRSCVDNSTCSLCKPGYFVKEGNCVTSCGAGFYLEETEQTCKACQGCDSCYGPTSDECQNCTGDKPIQFFGTCIASCPIGYFKDELKANTCTQCHSSCRTCNGPFENNCLSCPESEYFNDTNGQKIEFKWYFIEEEQICTVSCKQFGYDFVDEQRNLCLGCDDSCLSCQEQRTRCTSCPKGLYWANFQCLETCPEKYYPMKQTSECLMCSDNCKVCENFEKCTDCEDGSYLIDNFCHSTLPEGYYLDDAGAPQKCVDNCAVCSDNSTCTKCFLGFVLEEDTCSTTCKDGFYIDWNLNECKPCASGCDQCYDKHNCSQCASDFMPVYDDNQNMYCSDQCQQGHFKLNNECVLCNVKTPNCQECNKKGECLKCDGDFLLNDNHECITLSECPEGTYADTTTNQCKPCHRNCASCWDQFSDTCATCKSGLFLIDTHCTEQCSEGTLKDTNASVCIRCSQKCKTCAQDVDQCTSCFAGFYLKNGDCVLDCGDGLYEDYNNSTNDFSACQPCDDGCAKCHGPLTCMACETGKILDHGICVDTCPAGLINVEGRCEACSKNCEACSSLNVCTKCAPGFEVKGGICVNTQVKECENTNQYFDPLTLQCQDCVPPCATCYGPSANQCLTCQSGKLQYNQQECFDNCPGETFPDSTQSYCFDCPSQCTECTDFDTCTQCKPGFFLNSKGSCKQSCPEGTYQDQQENKCKPCQQKCKKCFGPSEDECQSCTDDYLTQVNPTNPDTVLCLDSCKSGYYKTTDDRCEECTYPCATCNGEGPKKCLSCKDQHFTVTNNKNDLVKCLTSCPIGFYGDHDDFDCKPCSQGCEVCYSQDQCDVCAPGYSRNDNFQCVQGCLGNQYSTQVAGSDQQICLPCNSPCTTCTSQTECTGCEVGYTLSGQKCEIDCNSPQWQGQDKPECQPCPDSCPNDCTTGPAVGHKVCTACESGFYLNNGFCEQECPRNSGLYTNTTNNTCDSCIDGCAQCSNNTSCEVCYTGLFLSNGNCIQTCEDGKFADHQTGKCKDCSSTCATCDESAYYCLTCPSGKYSQNGKCTSSCPDGTYQNQSSKTCEHCHPKCLTCSSYSTCTACNSTEGYYLHQNECKRSCPDGFFKGEDNNTQKCIQCAAGCATCTRSATFCSSCESGYYLNPNTRVCQDTVPQGYFFNTVTNELEKCQVIGCQTCTSADSCTLCDSGEDFNPATGKCPCGASTYTLNINDVTICVAEGQCPDGFFQNVNTMTCEQCSPICKTCADSSTCLSCRDDRTLKDNGSCACKEGAGAVEFRNECIYNCPEGFYTNSVTNECDVCSQNCLACASANQCYACAKGFVLIGDQCKPLDQCPEGTFADSTLNECQPCAQGCKNCDANQQCLECESQYFLVNGTCSTWCPHKKYPDYNSYTCIDCEDHCVECNEQDCYWCEQGFYLYKPDGSNRRACTQSCPDGKYAEQSFRECLDCTENCAQCQDQYVCLQCESGFNVVEGACQRGCPKGKYLNETNNQCSTCGDGCSQCDSLGNCLQCEDGYLTQYSFDTANNNQENITCVKQCPEGFVQEGNLPFCYPCHPFCATCTGFTHDQCATCNANYFSVNGGCYEFCPTGYFQQGQQCVECDSSCLSCDNLATTCTECPLNKILSHQNTCLDSCPEGTFLFENQFCEPCPHNCQSCENNFECITCAAGFFGVPFCQDDCVDGFYKQGDQCLECDSACSQCSDATQNCTVCAEDYFFNGSGQCVNHCDAGHYANWETKTCEPCHGACAQCFGPSEQDCQTCAEGFITLYNQCLSECPAGFYALTLGSNQKECTECPWSCITCESSEVCHSCRDDFLFVEETQSCEAYCPTGFYADFEARLCMSCGYKCAKCQNKECFACSDGFVLNSDKQCIPEDSSQNCNSNQVDYQGNCLDCPQNCNKCILRESPASQDVFTHCVECSTSSNFLLVNGKCKEPSGTLDGYYFDETLQEYKPCNPKCSSCQSKYECNACKKGFFLQGEMCQESCVDGYFVDTSDNSCKLCNEACQTCFGPSETDCKVCSYGLIKKEKQCVDSCPQGTYLAQAVEENFTSLQCKPCFKGCVSCEYDSKFCTQCKPGFFSFHGETCVEKCPEGTFPNSTSSECDFCPDTCTKCTSDNTCETCFEGYFLQQKSCVSQCKPGFFANYETGKCEKCDYSVCSTCVQTPKTCSSCAKGLMLINGVCQKQCPKGTYRSESTGNCEKCKKGCQECKGPFVTDCTVCQPGGPIVWSSLLQACVEECEFGYYADKQLGICNQCSHGCQSCENLNTCFECELNYFLFTLPKDNDNSVPHNECLEYCPKGYYVEEQSRSCKKCKTGCTSCYGSAFSCDECSEGFVLNKELGQCIQGECPSTHYKMQGENICHRCPETCRTCNSQGACLTCANGLIMSNDQTTCVDQCQDGYYRDNLAKSCQPCHANCSQCFGPGEQNCLVCASDLLLEGDLCVSSCKEGFYQVAGTNHCERCSPVCKSCQNHSDECTGCFPGQDLRSNSCVTDSCIEGFYKSTTGCSKCSFSCTACYGPSIKECTACKENYYLDGSSCVRRCPASTYLEENQGECVSCPTKCSSCLNEQQCTSCKPGFFYLAEDFHCAESCPDSFFLNQQNTCQKCLEQCSTCSDVQVCTSCASGYFLYNEWCYKECPSGLQADTELRVCTGCQVENCQQCYDGHCEVCKQGYELFHSNSDSNFATCRCQQGTGYYQGKCVRIPPLGHYINQETRLVEKCDDSCYSCTGPAANECTVCAEGTWLNDSNSCGSTCPSGYYSDGGNGCDKCTENCASCDNDSTCNECRDGFFKLENSDCVSYCPFGKITNKDTKTCEECQLNGCDFCIDEGKTCEICQDNYILVEGQCQTSCPDGLTALTQDGWTYCEKCNDLCLGCEENPNKCTSCVSKYFLQNNSCVPKCQPGYYGDESDSTCKQCDSSCTICDGPGPDNCKRCNGDFALVDTSCTTECPMGFFIKNNACKACDRSCKTCSGTATNCTACAPEYTDILGTCQKCDSKCGSCETSTDNCLECGLNHYEHDGDCIQQCPAGTYGNQNLRTCQPCSVNCSTCFGPYNDQCLQCADGFTGVPLCMLEKPNCQPGQFLEIIYSVETENLAVEYKCTDCADNCAQCTELDVCQVCKEGYTSTSYYIAPFNSCVQNLECDSNQYQTYDFQFEKFVCKPCSDGCATCVLEIPFEPASLYCKECESGLEFNPENPKSCLKADANDCQDFQYAKEVGNSVECIDCPEGCSACAPNNNGKKVFCSACVAGYFLRKEKWCVQQCLENQYLNENEKCKNCFRLCATCSEKGKNSCTTCIEGYELQSNGSCKKIDEQVNIPDCLGNAFFNQRRQECQCKNKALTYYQNLGCLTEEQWIEKTSCGVGEFYKQDISSCVTCTTNNEEFLCKSCFGEKPSQCTQCVDGYYLDSTTHTCLKCSANCSLCYSSDFCEICEPGTFQYYGFTESGRFEASCYRQGCPTGSKPSLSSLYYLNPSLFVDQEGTEYNFYEKEQQDQQQQQEGIAVAFGFYNEPIFSTEDLPWNYDNGLIYYKGKQIILECLPCYDFCDACIPGMFLLESQNRCVHFCPENFIPTTEGKCIPVGDAASDEVYIQYDHISANSDGVQEFSRPLLLQAHYESSSEFDIHWTINSVYSVEKKIEIDFTQDEQNEVFSGVDRESLFLEIPANRLLKDRLYVFSVQEGQKDFVAKIIVKQLPSIRPIEDIGIQPDLIFVEPLEGIAEKTEFVAKYIYNVPAITQSADEWVFSILVGENSVPYQSASFMDQITFKATQLPAEEDSKELAITFRARKGDEKFETKRFVTVKRNPDFNSVNSTELELLKKRITDSANAAAPSISELLHAAEIILNEIIISDYSQAVKDELQEFIEQIVAELQAIDIDDQNLLPVIKVLELAIQAEIFSPDTQQIVENIIAKLSSRIKDTTTFQQLVGTLESMNKRSKDNKVQGQTEEQKQETGIKTFNTLIDSAKNWASQFDKKNNKGVIDTDSIKGVVQNFKTEGLDELTLDLESIKSDDITSFAIDKSAYEELEEVSLLSIVTGSDFSKLPGEDDIVSDIADFSLINSKTGDEFKFNTNSEKPVKFDLGTNFDDVSNNEVPKPAEGKSFQCVFWDINNETWSNEGCETVSTSSNSISCSCSHLTSFSVQELADDGSGDNNKPGEPRKVVKGGSAEILKASLTFVLFALSLYLFI